MAKGPCLGIPITSRARVNAFLNMWLRTTAIADDKLLSLAEELKVAVADADVLGTPRPSQAARHPNYRAVGQALAAFNLVRENHIFTDAALHRLLQHALLMRPLIANAPFLGLISSRDVTQPIARIFNVREVRWFGVRGERDEPGTVTTRHYPDGFEAMRETLEVPYRGARFLVGAGSLARSTATGSKRAAA